mgnify:CR=1 FL=1
MLRFAAQKAGWTTPPGVSPDGAPVARGVALCACFGSFVAQIVEVSLSPEGRPRVHRVVAAVDCGITVNPGLAQQQIEGGILFGLSAALYGKVSFRDGEVQHGNFDSYPVIRMAESPRIEVHILPSVQHPGGLGEPGVPPIAPAVANALFKLTGRRHRQLPLISS